MQIIDLNDNTFTEEGSLAMAEVLPDLQDLRVINFGDCLVRSGGARAIAEALKDGHRQLEVSIQLYVKRKRVPYIHHERVIVIAYYKESCGKTFCLPLI